MIKKYITILLLALGLCNAEGQNTHFTFEEGMPAGVATYDEDGLEPSSDVTYAGFAPGTAWVTYDLGGRGHQVAVSTSWYATPGRSNPGTLLVLKTITGETVTVGKIVL